MSPTLAFIDPDSFRVLFVLFVLVGGIAIGLTVRRVVVSYVLQNYAPPLETTSSRRADLEPEREPTVSRVEHLHMHVVKGSNDDRRSREYLEVAATPSADAGGAAPRLLPASQAYQLTERQVSRATRR